MHIYFVRHGETEYNRTSTHQHPDVPLSAFGREQIEQTAEVLTKLNATKLITSDMLRALESAEIISQATKLSAEENELFREVRRPSSLYNKPQIGLATLIAGFHILLHLNERSYHYKDEENIFDIEDRVHQAVSYLSGLREEHENVIVVSHALIINMFVRYMCETKRVRRRDYIRGVISAKLFGNASITTVTYNDDHNPDTCDFLCVSLNDQSHLRRGRDTF